MLILNSTFFFIKTFKIYTNPVWEPLLPRQSSLYSFRNIFIHCLTVSTYVLTVRCMHHDVYMRCVCSVYNMNQNIYTIYSLRKNNKKKKLYIGLCSADDIYALKILKQNKKNPLIFCLSFYFWQQRSTLFRMYNTQMLRAVSLFQYPRENRRKL